MRDNVQFSTVLYQRTENVAWITLNRPDRMNSIGGTMKADLRAAFFELAEADDEVRCIVITGAGDRAFCAGADIKERAERQITPHEYLVSQKQTHELLRNIEQSPKPSIAAINGVAAGGGLEIALACDIRIAASHARIGLPEVRLGMIPAAGGTQRFSKLVGAAKAKELLFTGDLLDAREAHRIGVVNRVAEQGNLIQDTGDLARSIAKQPPLAVRLAKESVKMSADLTIERGVDFERYAAAMLLDTQDRKEGFRAFVEKRTPVYHGR